MELVLDADLPAGRHVGEIVLGQVIDGLFRHALEVDKKADAAGKVTILVVELRVVRRAEESQSALLHVFENQLNPVRLDYEVVRVEKERIAGIQVLDRLVQAERVVIT